MAAIGDRLRSTRATAALVLVVAASTIAGALVFEHVLGLRPCPLCLQQRTPYYVAIPFALAVAVFPDRSRWACLAILVLALIFLVSAGLGVHHAGVEWGWWAGPSDCAGAPPSSAGSMNDFLNQLQTTRVVSCTEVAWRFLGISLAGWNVLISLGLAAVASWSALSRPSRAGGSSSS